MKILIVWLGLAKVVINSSEIKLASPRTAKQKRKVARPDDYEVLKAKAAALNGKIGVTKRN